jgi:hypothetical protein
VSARNRVTQIAFGERTAVRLVEGARSDGLGPQSSDSARSGAGAVGRTAVGHEHVLDRQLEQRAQPLGDLLARHARAEPPLTGRW